MASLGFVRNESARQLRAGSSRILAYLMLDAGNPFFTDVARGVEEAARDGRPVGVPLQQQRGRRARGRLPRPARAAAGPGRPDHPGRPRLAAAARRSRRAARRWSWSTASLDDAEHCSVAVDDVLGGELAVDPPDRTAATRGSPSSAGRTTSARSRDRRAGRPAGAGATPAGPADSLVEVLDRRPDRRRGPRRRAAAGRPARRPPPDRRVLRQRPAGARACSSSA